MVDSNTGLNFAINLNIKMVVFRLIITDKRVKGMRILLKIILLTVVLMVSPVVAADVITGINYEMEKVGEDLRDIYPLIMKNAKQISPKEKTQLKTQVLSLQDHIEKATKMASAQSDTFRISYNTISRHFTRASRALDADNVAYAQSLLRSATGLCVSCHTQDQSDRFLTKHRLIIELNDPLQTADYYYITRNYQEALKIYQRFLMSQETLAWEDKTLEALDRVLSIYIQIERSPDKALNYFEMLFKSKLSDKYVFGDVSAWLQGLKIVIKDGLPTHGVDFKVLQSYMSRYVMRGSDMGGKDEGQAARIVIREVDRVPALWVRGLAFDYLNSFPESNETPILLYWLAIIDRSLEYDLHYSLTSLYLEQCIVGFSDHPYAQRCFDLYEDYINFSYTGSRGTFLSDEVKEELKLLKAYLKK